MRGVAGIIEPAVSIQDLTREILSVFIEYQQGERDLEAQSAKVEGIREKQRQRARVLGEKLTQINAALPHGTWLPWLTKAGIPERTAREWMDYFERSKSATNANVADLPVKERNRREPDIAADENIVRMMEAGDPETMPDPPRAAAAEYIAVQVKIGDREAQTKLGPTDQDWLRRFVQYSGKADDPLIEAVALILRRMVPGL